MHNEEGASRTMETLTIPDGVTIQIFYGEEIKIKLKEKINIDPRGTHIEIKNRSKGSNLISSQTINHVTWP